MSILWRNDNGTLISCVEKIKVMDQNMAELKSVIQDIIDDGVLMGVAEQQIKEEILKLLATMTSQY
jgi:hypothetical protein